MASLELPEEECAKLGLESQKTYKNMLPLVTNEQE